MNLQHLELRGFRSYKTLSLDLEPGTIHVFSGPNAQGKTNLVEAVYYLSNLRSFRTSRTEALVNRDSPGFFLQAAFENDRRKETITASWENGSKRLTRFGNPVASYSSFVGVLNAVLFCPDDLGLFSAAPALRRKFLDTEMVKLSRSFTAALRQYQQLLKQRNLALKERRANGSLLDAYDMQLAAVQKEIVEERAAFVQALAAHAARLYPAFSQNRERLDLDYATFVDVEKDLEPQILDILKNGREKDIRTGHTSSGIHKDDLIFLLDGHPVRESASQGQKRSVLLALKLALCLVIEEKTGQLPVLLLDDVFSELDASRRQTLIELLPEGMQVLVTAAGPVLADWKGRKTVFHTVENGRIRRNEHEPESNRADGQV